MAKIGDRRQDGKIYAGPDYGYQSPATFKKLKKDGAFKLGASAVRRTKQLASKAADAIKSRLPKSVKETVKRGAKWYAESEKRANQRLLDRGYTQKQIDEANRVKAELSMGSGEADAKAIKFLSDKTNIAPEIVGGGITAATMAIDARMGAKTAQRSLTNAVRKMDAPVAYAMGGKKKKIDTSIIPGMKLTRDSAGRALPGKERIFERDGKFYQWVATKPPGKRQGAYVDSDGIVRTNRLDTTGASWQLEEVRITPDEIEEGAFVIETVDSLANLPPPKPKRKPEALDVNRGSTRQTPKSQAQFDAPRGNRRGRRVEAKDTTPPETFLDVEDVHTSDMSKNYSTGNEYDRTDNIPEQVPAVERSAARRQALATKEQKAIAAKIEKRLKSNNTKAIKEAVFMADGDYDKLAAIAIELGVDPARYTSPSQLERALNKRISSIEQTYAGKPTLTVEERAQVKDQFDRENLTGATRAEQKRLSELATQQFGAGKPGRRRIKQRLGDGRLRANTAPDARRPKETPVRSEPDKPASARSDAITERRDREYLMERYEYETVTDKRGRKRVVFLTDEEGAYIPKGKGIKPTAGPKDPDFTRKIRRRMRSEFTTPRRTD